MGEPFQLGRYSLCAELASGGMATVYVARLNGPVGFGRTVAIKRLHPHLARDPEFAAMFLDEARLAARVQHPNVVPTLDVVAAEQELFLVLEYVRGENLGNLLHTLAKAKATVPMPVATSILIGALNGLHAAHEAKDEQNRPLELVHRDVSPQNILVGVDGVARVLDFGVAKAATRLQTTREGQLKGKLPYLAPEQLAGETSRATDVYAAGVVLWEMLTCKRLFSGKTEAELLNKILTAEVPAPSTINPNVPAELDRITLKATARAPAARYASALEMAADIDQALRPASAMVVTQWLEGIAGPALAERHALVSEIESGSLRAVARPELLKELAGSVGRISTDGSGQVPLPLPPPPSSAATIGTHSSASMASLTYKTPATKPPSRVALWVGAGVALVVLAGAGVFLSRGGTTTPTAASPTTSASASASASASTSTSISTPTSASQSPSASPSTSTAATPPPDAGVAASSRAPAAAVPKRRGGKAGGKTGGAGSQPSDLDSLLDSH
jgi:serine/threonine protein kinase